MAEIVLIQLDELKMILSEVINKQLAEKTPQSDTQADEFLTTKQTQLLLKISKPTLYARMRDGSVPFKKIGRRVLFPKNEILKSFKYKINRR